MKCNSRVALRLAVLLPTSTNLQPCNLFSCAKDASPERLSRRCLTAQPTNPLSLRSIICSEATPNRATLLARYVVHRVTDGKYIQGATYGAPNSRVRRRSSETQECRWLGIAFRHLPQHEDWPANLAYNYEHILSSHYFLQRVSPFIMCLPFLIPPSTSPIHFWKAALPCHIFSGQWHRPWGKSRFSWTPSRCRTP